MAKIAVCDQCGRTERLHLGSLPPGGWVELQEHSTGANPPAVQVCSFGCAAAYASHENAKRTGAARVRAAGVATEPADEQKPGPFPRPALRLPDHDDEPAAASEAGHVRAAQADSSDEGGGYVSPGDGF